MQIACVHSAAGAQSLSWGRCKQTPSTQRSSVHEKPSSHSLSARHGPFTDMVAVVVEVVLLLVVAIAVVVVVGA